MPSAPITRSNTSRLLSWNFAADGVWENAFTHEAGTVRDWPRLEHWLSARSQDIAFEAVFGEAGSPSTLIGVRIAPLAKADQIRLVRDLVRQSAQIDTQGAFLEVMAALIPQWPLFSRPPSALNIGIVDQWFSFAPVELWHAGLKLPLDADHLRSVAPRYFDVTPNPAAVEYWCTEPVEHWFKIYVSKPVPGGYQLDPQTYADALERLS